MADNGEQPRDTDISAPRSRTPANRRQPTMWTTLRRLQTAWTRSAPPPEGRPRGVPAVPAAGPAPRTAGEESVPPVLLLPPDPLLDQRFAGLLLKVAHWDDTAPNASEQETLKRLAALVAQPQADAVVPRRPTALPRLLGLMQDDNASPRELAALVAQDPALLGEVMRLANSVHYRGERRMESLEQALMMLGQWGLRQLVTRALMTPVFSARQGRFGPQANPRLWDEAARCAHGCAWLSQTPETRFDAYLAGMVADTGLIAALRLMDQVFPADAPVGSSRFLAELLSLAARLSAGIARQWHLPGPVIAALAAHAEACGREHTAPAPGLGANLETALRCARLLMLRSSGVADAEALAPASAPCLQELERVFLPAAQTTLHAA